MIVAFTPDDKTLMDQGYRALVVCECGAALKPCNLEPVAMPAQELPYKVPAWRSTPHWIIGCVCDCGHYMKIVLGLPDEGGIVPSKLVLKDESGYYADEAAKFAAEIAEMVGKD